LTGGIRYFLQTRQRKRNESDTIYTGINKKYNAIRIIMFDKIIDICICYLY
jgi:hypothetical protein